MGDFVSVPVGTVNLHEEDPPDPAGDMHQHCTSFHAAGLAEFSGPCVLLQWVLPSPEHRVGKLLSMGLSKQEFCPACYYLLL